jgi:hypothetical protein
VSARTLIATANTPVRTASPKHLLARFFIKSSLSWIVHLHIIVAHFAIEMIPDWARIGAQSGNSDALNMV